MTNAYAYGFGFGMAFDAKPKFKKGDKVARRSDGVPHKITGIGSKQPGGVGLAEIVYDLDDQSWAYEDEIRAA